MASPKLGSLCAAEPYELKRAPYNPVKASAQKAPHDDVADDDLQPLAHNMHSTMAQPPSFFRGGLNLKPEPLILTTRLFWRDCCWLR